MKILKRICVQILNCLIFLGKYKIIHCDLKPENILLVNSHKSKIKVY